MKTKKATAKVFSVPLNPKLEEKDYYKFLDFLKEYKDYIYDVYFTTRIAPFGQDAMGDVFASTNDAQYLIEAALHIQNNIGIPVSATFNNIEVRPDQQNLDLWIKNYKPLYDAGIYNCTLPHTHWMMTGQVKKHFPKLFVKNTILRQEKEPRDVALLAKAGFDYVNLDRVLMRDHDRIKEIAKVKEKYNVKLSLLANEGCLGGCSVMPEHFQFNNTRTDGPQYFSDPISRVSCPKWDTENIAVQLKTANFTPWKEDWIELLDIGIDTIKMHGRESISRLWETVDIIKRFANNDDILFDTFNDYIKDSNMEGRPIDGWRKIIKTCKFDCWDCNFCDKVWKAKGNSNVPKIERVAQALIDCVNVDVDIDIEGLSSKRTQSLLNILAGMSTHYLEVGVLSGSTFCAAINNNNITAYAIDHFKDDTQAATGSDIKANKQTFIENVKKYKGNNSVHLFDCDFRKANLDKIEKIDLMFYDADHDPKSNIESLVYFKDKLADESIIIFDDANFDGVVDSVREGMKIAGLNIVYDKIILNDIEDPDQWWNGLYIMVIKKENL